MPHEKLDDQGNIVTGKTLQSAVILLTTTDTVVAAVSGKRIKVFAICLSVTAALSLNWRDGGSISLGGLQSLGINGGYAMVVNPPNFIFGTTKGNSLDLVISGSGTVAGWVSYWTNDAA